MTKTTIVRVVGILLAIGFLTIVGAIASEVWVRSTRPDWYRIEVRNRSSRQFTDVRIAFSDSPFRFTFGRIGPGNRAAYGNVAEPVPKEMILEWTVPDGSSHSVRIPAGDSLQLDFTKGHLAPTIALTIDEDSSVSASVE